MTATRLVFAISALYGAAGVALLAYGAHAGGQNATTAGQMLLFHACAAMAATLARKAGHLSQGAGRLGVALLLAGVALFAADLTALAARGAGLFRMAAPIGGTATIVGWLLLALAASLGRRDA
jgi:uncharacterized membrane protein YgdD (TMEM256/DUF423 family)